MYIGEASKQTGLSIKAIRFYEKKGLIRPPSRIGRYRVYQPADIELLVLIREAKALGITLSQLKEVIAYCDGEVVWAKIKIFLGEVRAQLVDQLADTEKKIDLLDECYNQIKA